MRTSIFFVFPSILTPRTNHYVPLCSELQQSCGDQRHPCAALAPAPTSLCEMLPPSVDMTNKQPKPHTNTCPETRCVLLQVPLYLHIVCLCVLLRVVLYPYIRECSISTYLCVYIYCIIYMYTLESSAALRAALIHCISKIEG